VRNRWRRAAALALVVALLPACTGRQGKPDPSPSNADNSAEICAEAAKVNLDHLEMRTPEGQALEKVSAEVYKKGLPRDEVRELARAYLTAWTDAIRSLSQRAQKDDLRTALNNFIDALLHLGSRSEVDLSDMTIVTAWDGVDTTCGLTEPTPSTS
jgi:hypothetical protein